MNLHKQWMRKAAAMFAAFLLLAVTFAMPASADIFSGLEAAEDLFQSSVLRLFTNIIAPVGFVLCVAAAIILGIMIGTKHSKGDDTERLGKGLFVAIIIGILLGAFSVWGPLMLNTTPSAGV